MSGRRLPGKPCRSERCRAPIAWVIVRSTGKRMPVDVEPVENGTIAVSNTTPPLAIVLSGDELLRAREHGQALYVSHFATCPEATKHRRR